MLPSRFVHVARCMVRSYVTENTCPGSVGVLKLYPVYETQAWFTLFGSIAMDVIDRCGSFVADCRSDCRSASS